MTHPTSTTRAARPSRRTGPAQRAAGLAVLLALLLPVAACASEGVGTSDSEAVAGAGAVSEGDAAVAGGTAAVTSSTVSRLSRGSGNGTVGTLEPQLISTGHVSLSADDVEDAVSDARGLAAGLGGTVSDASTRADHDGTVQRAGLTLRVPSDAFDEAMAGLSDLGVLRDATSSSEDVTTQVVDTAVRVRVQRRSIRRIEELLDRARSIRDVVRVEAQLTRRQAALTSLLRQQAALADRTSLSTITLDVRLTEEVVVGEAEDATGFVAGLRHGWRALVGVVTGGATALGAVLPFAVPLALVGVPGYLVVRRRRRAAASAGGGISPAG
ncbi:DUF4349 domain-containing protein [Nocardioides sp. GY 10127]|nr:DUF4349 domain-containing protein [Nocardioides sp. GY 10127]